MTGAVLVRAPMTPHRALMTVIIIAVILLGLAALGNAGIIFALLVALMLTGMPISIALGLTVLTFLFTMTSVPIESVGLKLFTGIEKFEIMAVPFFILAGKFLPPRGGGRRPIEFSTPLGGALPRG